jgi:hypothetical protein
MVEHIPTNPNGAQDPAQTDRPPVAEAKPVAPTARRRLLRTGLIGGPVALLTAGKPVKTLASSYYCNMSGWNSINVSKKKGKSGKSGSKGKTLSHTPATGTCSTGKPPSSWITTSKGKTVPNDWPSSFNGHTLDTKYGTTKFSTVFGSSPNNLQNDSLLTILSSQSSTVEAYIIAAAFSSEKVGGFIPSSQVASIWSTWGNNTTDGSTTNSVALLSFLQQLV